MSTLSWPYEGALPLAGPRFIHAESNICLDFHGDLQRAQLVVFSDGNHHMALEQSLQAFLADNPAAQDVFYATTPPRIIIEALKEGAVNLGNLRLACMPHLFISPPKVLDRLVADGCLGQHQLLARTCGSVLLVKKDNPKSVHGLADLARDDIRLFISNPVTETISYETYAATLLRLAAKCKLSLDLLDRPDHPRIIHGVMIHHREAPQALVDDRADCAIVFHHLALRYERIFPQLFETVQISAPGDPDNLVSDIHIGVVGDGGKWGRRALDFLSSERTRRIYRHHGLNAER
jgi:hypothetical protein